MSSPSRKRSPSETQLAQLHLAFSSCPTPAAFFTPDPTPSPAYIADVDPAFEPLEPSVAESAEDEFAARAQRALLALSTPPSASSARMGAGAGAGAVSGASSPELGQSASASPEHRGGRDGYFSRCLFASAEGAGISSAYASGSGTSTPALQSAHSSGYSTPASMPTTPPDEGSLFQSLTPLSLAALNKANMKARGLRLPPPPSARTSPEPAPIPEVADVADAPLKAAKGFDLDLGLGILSSNFGGISLAAGRSGALPKDLVEVERPSSPAFRLKARRTQYAF